MSIVGIGRRCSIRLAMLMLRALASAALTIVAIPVMAQGDYSVHDGTSITYQLTPDTDATSRHVDVKVSFEITGSPAKVSVQMPVWSPGDYHIQNHAKYVQSFKAVAQDGNGYRSYN